METYLFQSKYQKSYSSFSHRETIPIIIITKDRIFFITLNNFYITKRSPIFSNIKNSFYTLSQNIKRLCIKSLPRYDTDIKLVVVLEKMGKRTVLRTKRFLRVTPYLYGGTRKFFSPKNLSPYPSFLYYCFCIRTKWLYSGKYGCIRAQWLYSGKRGCIRTKMAVFGQNGYTWVKVL